MAREQKAGLIGRLTSEGCTTKQIASMVYKDGSERGQSKVRAMYSYMRKKGFMDKPRNSHEGKLEVWYAALQLNIKDGESLANTVPVLRKNKGLSSALLWRIGYSIRMIALLLYGYDGEQCQNRVWAHISKARKDMYSFGCEFPEQNLRSPENVPTQPQVLNLKTATFCTTTPTTASFTHKNRNRNRNRAPQPQLLRTKTETLRGDSVQHRNMGHADEYTEERGFMSRLWKACSRLIHVWRLFNIGSNRHSESEDYRSKRTDSQLQTICLHKSGDRNKHLLTKFNGKPIVKIAVVGIGVAGAYLVNRLSREHDVIGFERMHEENHDSICAWGTTRGGMDGLTSKCGLNFDDYVLHDGLDMIVEAGKNSFSIKLKGLCTYDKIKLIKDMSHGVKIHYGGSPSRDVLEQDFDLVVDATGFHRVLLPKPKNELWVPTIQYKVKYDRRPFDDFMIRPFPNMSGYFWYFPLENGYAHIGAGDKHRKHVQIVDEFLKEYGGDVLKKVGRPIRLSPPALCEPFYDGKVVGVGESIGTVYALLGEGIIPSTICADLFVDNVNDLQRYRKLVLEKFKIYHSVFNFVKNKINDEFSMMKHLPDLIKIYSYMKKRENRFGMEIRMSDMMKITKV